MEMNIDTNGKNLVNTDVNEFEPGRIVTTHTYDDGTILKFEMNGGDVNVKSNKKLELQPDGETVKIID
jgi:hypothetical protein